MYSVEVFKALMRILFIVGLMLSIDAIVTPGDQMVESAIGSILSAIGIFYGWYDFENSD